ncbi:MAG: hypothetical protein R3E89_01810 [Thiolinea sp.]
MKTGRTRELVQRTRGNQVSAVIRPEFLQVLESKGGREAAGDPVQ